MPITNCFDTLLINSVDIRTWAYITNAEGLLSRAPQKGDLIEQDWVAGAIWQKGPKAAFTFEVPVVMKSRQQDVALGQLRALQAMVGDQKALTRRLTVNGVEVSETMQAVMANAVQIGWQFSSRARVDAVLVWQALEDWTSDGVVIIP
jgi:hypothetical protein